MSDKFKISDYYTEVLKDRPISYWRLGESSGLIATDICGGRDATYTPNSGSWTGGTLGVTGALLKDVNTSATFNGTTGYAITSAYNFVNFATSGFSTEAWVKTTSTNTQLCIVTCYTNTGPNYPGFLLSLGDGSGPNVGKPTLWVSDTTYAVASNAINDGNWHHICANCNSSGLVSFYVDGVFVNRVTKTITGLSSIVAQPIYIGSAQGTSAFFSGTVDEVSIYDYVLSADRIYAHYQAGRGTGSAKVTIGDYTEAVLMDNPISYWPLTVGTQLPNIPNLELWLDSSDICNITTGSGIATWYDKSGNNRDATQTSSSLQPIYTTNIVGGRPIVRFNGSTQYFNLPNFLTGFTGGEIFIVIKIDTDPPGGSAQTGIYDFGANPNSHYTWTDGVIYDDFGSTVRKTTVNPTPALTSWRVYNVTSISGEWTSRLDSSQIYTTASNTVGWSTAPLFGRSNAGYYLDGDVAEVIMYSRKLSTTERASVEKYLATKYGLTYATPTFDDIQGAINGTSVNNPNTTVSGPIVRSRNNTCLLLNGSNQYVNCTNDLKFRIDTGTAEAWFKTSGAGASYRGIITKQTAWGIYLSGNVLTVFDWVAGAPIFSSGSYNDGLWHHVVLTFDSGITNGSRLYLDGVLVGQFSINISAHTVQISIGDGGAGIGQYFGGNIAHCAFYGYNLSLEQIRRHYNIGSGKSAAKLTTGSYEQIVLSNNPVGYWKLDDSYFNIVKKTDPYAYWPLNETSGTTAIDYGKHKANGTYTGTYTLGQTGAIANDSATSVNFAGGKITVNNLDFTFQRNESFSFNLFAKLDSSSSGILFGKMTNTAPYTGYDLYYGTTLETQIINTWTSNAISRSGSTTVNNNTWKMITMTYDGSSSATGVKMYINGVEESYTTNFNSLSSTIIDSSVFVIGDRATASDPANGNMQHVACWKRVLSQLEITNLYNASTLKAYDNSNNYSLVGTPSGSVVLNQSGNILRQSSYTSGTFASSSNITIPARDDLFAFTSGDSITIECWCYPTDLSNYRTILNRGTDAVWNRHFALRFDNTGILSFYFGYPTNSYAVWQSSSSVASINNWYHIAVTFTFGNSSSIVVYVNGSSVAGSWSGSGSSTPVVTSGANLYIGSLYTSSESFIGKIQHLAIYRTFLSAADIRRRYNAGIGK